MGCRDLSRLKSRLTLDLSAAPPPHLQPAGVLVPLFLTDGSLRVLLTQRTWTVKDHRGQIAFPGGVRDPGDANLLQTALRETEEEIGLKPEAAQVLGSLKPVATVTGYWIRAYAALIPYPYDFRLNAREVQRLLPVPLEALCDVARWSTGRYVYKEETVRVCYWRENKTVIWGATARILLSLLKHLDSASGLVALEGVCVD